MRKLKLLLSVAFVVLAVRVSFSQGNASLTGQVKDESGAVLHGVVVKAKNGTGITFAVPTKLDGKFKITGLWPGTYEVRAERRGFVGAPQKINVSSSAKVNFMLKPGLIDRLNLSTSDLAKTLPDSPYKQELLACELCHSLGALAQKKQYRTEFSINWIKVMNQRNYTRLKDADIQGMAEYLQANFGPNSTFDAKLPPEPIDEQSLNIKYIGFDIPTWNAMPHTAVPDGKGNVWFTEYGGAKIGVIHVKTGQIEEFDIPNEMFPGAHGITVDPFGNIWFTEQTGGAIGRFDPKTRTIKEYAVPPLKNKRTAPTGGTERRGFMPDNIRNASPHTLISDKDGNIWFTAGADPVRKLDPKTGEFTEYVIKEGGGGLYGITYDPKTGRLWYAGIGINEVGYIDPATGKVTHFPMLTERSGPRRIKIDSKGVAWTNLYNVSKLVRVDPTTGKVTEWDLPGPRDAQPYPLGIDAKDRIWTQSAQDDNLYMFDPKTEKFTTYLMPDKGQGLRDMFLDEEGRLWTASFGHSRVTGFKLEERK